MNSHFALRNLFAIFALMLLVHSSEAITTFTVNGETELEVVDGDTELKFEADVSKPGGTLKFSLLIDANGNGIAEPGIDADLLESFGIDPVITDGKTIDQYSRDFQFYGPEDQDGVANGKIVTVDEASNIFPGVSTHPYIVYAVDQDGTSEQLIIRTTPPELQQSISGKIVDEKNLGIEGVIILAYSDGGFQFSGDGDHRVDDFPRPLPPIDLEHPIETDEGADDGFMGHRPWDDQVKDPNVDEHFVDEHFVDEVDEHFDDDGDEVDETQLPIVDLPFEEFPPIITVTDADGNYFLPTIPGEVFVVTFPKKGYYVPKVQIPVGGMIDLSLNFPFPASIDIVEVGAGEKVTDQNFTLVEDLNPPKISHEPFVEAMPIVGGVEIRVDVIDSESGVQFIPLNMPTLHFRPKGSGLPFSEKPMIPDFDRIFGGMEGFFPEFLGDADFDFPMPGMGMGEDSENFAFPIPKFFMRREALKKAARNQMMPEPHELPTARVGVDLSEFMPSRFVTFLDPAELSEAGIEYYFTATDFGGNVATDPASAPAELYVVELKASEFSISGKIIDQNGDGIPGVVIYASLHRAQVGIPEEWLRNGEVDPKHLEASEEGNEPMEIGTTMIEPDFEWRPPIFEAYAKTISAEDGSYTLQLPSDGTWRVSIEPPYGSKFFSPGGEKQWREVAVPNSDGENRIAELDFELLKDEKPPTIKHNPKTDVEVGYIGEPIVVKAFINDEHPRINARLLPIGLVVEDRDYHPTFRGWLRSGNEWVFHVPAEFVRSETFSYTVEATDGAENEATSGPHELALKASPYQISGVATNSDGHPLAGVKIEFIRDRNEVIIEPMPVVDETKPQLDENGKVDGKITETMLAHPHSDFWIPPRENGYRHGVTDENGEFSVSVSQGLWHVRAYYHELGFVLAEEIEPIELTETAPTHELKIVFTVDLEPPVITHKAVESYKLGNPIVVEADVSDNNRIGGVYLFVSYRKPNYHIMPTDPLRPSDKRQSSDGQFVIESSDVPESGEIRKPIDRDKFIIDEYFEPIAMHSRDGKHYVADLRYAMRGLFANGLGSLRYFIKVSDVAGNVAMSPGSAPEELHEVEITPGHTVSGIVLIDGNPIAGVEVLLSGVNAGLEFQVTAVTDGHGRYKVPAIYGANEVKIVPPEEVEFEPKDGDGTDVIREEFNIASGEDLDSVNFRLASVSSTAAAELAAMKAADYNDDNEIDIFDLVFVASHFGKEVDASATVNPDVNGDGEIDIFDLVKVASYFGETISGEIFSSPEILIDENFAQIEPLILSVDGDIATVALKISTDELQVSGVQFDLSVNSDVAKVVSIGRGKVLDDGNHASFWHEVDRDSFVNVALGNAKALNGSLAILTLKIGEMNFGDRAEINVENLQVLSSNGELRFSKNLRVPIELERLVVPKVSKLLNNYPNPFNPETWIPFELGEDSEVSIKIYDKFGQLVRNFELGKRSVGLYVSQERAIHWDGTNQFGEQVASGTYFYSIETENYRSTKQMLVLK